MSTNIRPLHFTKNLPKNAPDLIPRSGHRIVVDNKYLYCWGGFNPEYWTVENTAETEYPLLKELWRYNFWTQEWKKLPTHGDVPTELASHNIIKVRNHILHFGGTGIPFGGASTNCLYDLDLDTLEWRRLVEGNDSDNDDIPSPKYGHSMTCVDGDVYIIGGTSGYTYDCDIHRLDLRDLTWRLVRIASKQCPEPRYRHEVVHYRGKLFMFGGGTGISSHGLDQIDIFEIQTRMWHSVKTLPFVQTEREIEEYPSGRRCHSCTPFQDYMYMCGGMTMENITPDVWRFHFPTYQWTKIVSSLPKPVYFHSSAVTQDGCLYIFGGVCQIDDERTNYLQSTWLHIPNLQILAWNVIVHHLDIAAVKKSKQTLLGLGIPVQYVDTIL